MTTFYNERLVHRAQWGVTTNSSSPADMFGGNTTISSTSTISCFCYSNAFLRTPMGPVITGDGSYSMLVPVSLLVAENDYMINVRDEEEILIVTKARVKSITQLRHDLHSEKAKILTLTVE